MALVYVLGAISLISVVAVSLLSVGSASYRLSRNVLEIVQADTIAEAAHVRAVLGLLDSRASHRWRVDGVPQTFTFQDATLRVTIQDELGRLDLNHADRTALTGLLQWAGLDASSASKLTDEVLDWREANDTRHLAGATPRDYQEAGYAYRPRKGPFQSVDELRLVMGMSEELFQRVAPALTVHSGRQFIDPQYAPQEALLALSSGGAGQMPSIKAGRAHREAGIIPLVVPLAGRAFSIRIEIEGSGTAVVRDVTVRLTDNAAQPYLVLDWRTQSSHVHLEPH